MGVTRTPAILDQYERLPPEAKQEAADFISFLGVRYSPRRAASAKHAHACHSGKFFGMWRDRADMADSTAWVRRARRSHWR
jgi:hypothetical protein